MPPSDGFSWFTPTLLDAAIGTRLIALGLDLAKDDPALWNLTRPDSVAALHAEDVASGARILLTNTFGANRKWLAQLGLQDDVRAINRAGVDLARASAAGAARVFGSIGPTAAASLEALREQAMALIEAGADALVLETHEAPLAATALPTLRSLFDGPIVVSLFEWPEPIRDWAARFETEGASVLGVNCVGVDAAVAIAERLSRSTRLPLWVKPNAGPPGAAETPCAFARVAPALSNSGVAYLGGCCGATSAHLAALRDACYALELEIHDP